MIEKFYSKVDKKILLFSIISTKNVNEKEWMLVQRPNIFSHQYQN